MNVPSRTKLAYQFFGYEIRNKYHDTIVGLLRQLGYQLVDTSRASLKDPAVRVAVFNWFFPSSGGFRDVLVKPLSELVWMKLRGKHLVFVHHNAVAHDSPFPRGSRFIQALAYRLAKVIIVHNHSDETELRKKYRNKVEYVPHPHYYPIYGAPVAKPSGTGEVRFGFLGAVRPYKNLEVLIDAFKQIEGSRVRLEIRGRAHHQHYAEKIRSLVSSDPRISFNDGFVPDELVPEVLSRIDVLVMPYSLESASNSGSAILAASYAVPFVVSAIPGLAEWPILPEFRYDYADQQDHVAALGRRLRQVAAFSKVDLESYGAQLQQYCLQELDHGRTRIFLEKALQRSWKNKKTSRYPV